MRRIISWAVRLSTLMAFAPTSNPRAIIFSRNSGIGILNLLASSDKFILHNHSTNIFKNQGLNAKSSRNINPQDFLFVDLLKNKKRRRRTRRSCACSQVFPFLYLPGKLEAGIESVPISMGSGELFRKCRLISAPVTGPSTPAWLKRAVAPAGQLHGRSLLPVSITPVSLQFAHLGIIFLLSRNNIFSGAITREEYQSLASLITSQYSTLCLLSQGCLVVFAAANKFRHKVIQRFSKLHPKRREAPLFPCFR